MRDVSPITRCKECGMVTVCLVYDRGIGDDGEWYSAMFRDTIPHSRKDCAEMVKLMRESWPTLW